MPDNNTTEFSLHEMENLKRRMNGAEDSSGVPSPMRPESASSVRRIRHKEGPPAGPPPDPNLPPQAAFSEHAADGESLQLRRIFRVIRRHTFIIFFIFILLPLAVWAIDTYYRTPIYLAQAPYERLKTNDGLVVSLGRMQIKMDSEKGDNIDRLLQQEELRPYLRRELAARVEEMEALKDQIPDPEKKKEWIEAIRGLKAMVGDPEDEKTPEGFEQYLGEVYSRAFTETDGVLYVRGPQVDELHRLVAGSLVETLNRFAMHERRRAIDKFLQEQTSLLQEKEAKLRAVGSALESVEAEIADLVKDVAVPEDMGPVQLSARQRGETQRLELAVLQKKLERLKQDAGWEDLVKTFGLASEKDIRYVLVEGNPLRTEWLRLQTQQEDLARRYTPEHPRMIDLNREIAAIRQKLETDGGLTSAGVLPPLPTRLQENALREIRTISEQLWEARIRLEMLVGETAGEGVSATETKPGGRALTPAEKERLQEVRIRRDRLNDSKKNDMQGILTLSNSLDETRLLKNHIETDNLFLPRGEATVFLESPRLSLDIGLGAVLGLIIGVAVAFFLESVDNRLHTPFDVYYHLRLNYLGVIPHWGNADQLVISPEKPDSHIAEIYAHLRTNIRYSRPSNPEKVLMIASATQGEGKSTVAANLAISYALEGNTVILIDADLRRPRGHKLIDIFHEERHMEHGLSDCLTGDATFEEALYTTTVPGLSLMPAGSKVRNPAKLMGSPDMRGVLQSAEQRFDIVVVDCPAVLPVVDATTLSGHVRGVLMVIAAEEVEVGAVRMALYRLQHVGSPIVGAVLNKVRERSTSYYYYGYRYGGGYYYSPYRKPYASDEELEQEQTG